MTRGRKPVATFTSKDLHINELATTATNNGAYTVESLTKGMCYFLQGDRVVIATWNGFMEMHISTAKMIASELPQILQDYDHDRRNGLVQMSTRDIQRMLEV